MWCAHPQDGAHTPWAGQCAGTLSCDSKKRTLSSLVLAVSVLMRVRLIGEEPGSLNPMWPFGPMSENLDVHAPGGMNSVLFMGVAGLHPEATRASLAKTFAAVEDRRRSSRQR